MDYLFESDGHLIGFQHGDTYGKLYNKAECFYDAVTDSSCAVRQVKVFKIAICKCCLWLRFKEKSQISSICTPCRNWAMPPLSMII